MRRFDACTLIMVRQRDKKLKLRRHAHTLGETYFAQPGLSKRGPRLVICSSTLSDGYIPLLALFDI